MKRIATTLLVASLMATPMLVLPATAHAAVSIGIGVSVGVPPPALPVYSQPIAPGPGYLWTPGYWAWDPSFGYYWVPGSWVMPPQIGLLWTPGWWGWSDGYYRWTPGYWGTHVGFYGGVNYGYGYFGNGYAGGYWRGNNFFYNRAVNNVNITNIRNVYVDRTVINNINTNRVSYNGGRGGIVARPSAQQRTWASQRRFQATAPQTRQRETAMRDPAQRFKANRGRPAVFATQHAGNFGGPHAVRAPAPVNSRMVASPERARPMARAPQRGMVEAPRDRVQQPNRPAQQPPRRERERVMQAPRERAQPARPMVQQERRSAPAQERAYERAGAARARGGEYRGPAARPAPATRGAPPSRGNERGKARPKDDNGPGH
ncbi:MAG TPA: hypothetical protein VFS86_08460 [Rhodanobacteraceae bacterium]|nr:hypothetical protein [Rhodanobacteraceae bacterium]